MAETPACPRCGYDQRGVIDSWTQSCPMTGVCSECGLTFEWGDLLGVRAERLAGFFEHANGLRRWFWWAWRTWFLALLPNRFWSRVRMYHRIVPRRIWMWLMVTLLQLHAVGLLASIAGIWIPRGLNTRSYSDELWSESVETLFEPIATVWLESSGGSSGGWQLGIDQFGVTHWPLSLTVGLAVWFVIAFVFSLLSDTRRVYKVRLSHTARVCLYGLAWAVPFVAAYAMYRVFMALEYVDAMSLRSQTPGRGFYQSGRYWDIAMWMRTTNQNLDKFLVVPVLAWIVWWWWAALSKGLEIDRARQIWCVLMVPAALTTAVVLAIVYVARVQAATGW